MNRPPRPQFVFRPNLRCEDDRRAWQLLQAAPDGNRKALIVRALLQSEQEHRLEETVRRAVREELEKAQIAFAAPPPQDGKGIPKAALDFFSNIVIKIEGSGSHAVLKRAQTRLCGLLLLLAFRCNSQ